MNIVLMAGGGGTRLWPVSRDHNPKQFLDLGSGKTLIEHTYDRAQALTEQHKIYVATTSQHEERVRQLLPDISDDHIFLEPEKRDTGPAFAAVARQLVEKGVGEEPTIFMWSDHVFTAEKTFIKDLNRIAQLVENNPETVIIMGHKPTFPETVFGYVEIDGEVSGEPGVYQVLAFKEKPDLKTAEEYVAAGRYFWNMAYISAKPAYLVEQLREHAPETMAGIDAYVEALAQKDEKAAHTTYANLPKVAIDYILLEKTPRILIMAGDYGWSDVGNWGAVCEVFGYDGDHSSDGHHIHVDSQDNYVYNTTNRAVSLIGIKNTIVVVTDDAILVTDKSQSHKVKDVVKRLEEEAKDLL